MDKVMKSKKGFGITEVLISAVVLGLLYILFCCNYYTTFFCGLQGVFENNFYAPPIYISKLSFPIQSVFVPLS